MGDGLVESAKRALDEKRTQDQGSLEKDVKELAEYLGRLEELRNIQNQVRKQESTIQSTQSELEAVYDGLTSDQLRGKLAVAKCAATTESIKARIARDAIDLISRDTTEELPCPICDSRHDRTILEKALQDTVNRSNDALSPTVAALESRLQESEALNGMLSEHKGKLPSLNEQAVAAMSLVQDEDKRRLAETNDIGRLIENYSGKESDIKAHIDDQGQWFDSKTSQLNRLEDEGRFHGIQKNLNDLQAGKRELERVIESYKNFVAFGESVRTISGVVKSRLTERLVQDIPRVSEVLSKAFSALTQHPWYDRLIISQGALPKLRLRVASSRDPTGREDPTGVLNGQAESALNLVPHFAFSQTDDTPTEVYLVMLDDPTRALDTEHIKILVERLRELGRNVQLIVASQETERLQKMIPSVFDEGSYAIVEPTGWSPHSGPNLNVKYE